MLKAVSIAIGILSFTAAAILGILDYGLFLIHSVLRAMSDKFAQDGEVLTGWRVPDNG